MKKNFLITILISFTVAFSACASKPVSLSDENSTDLWLGALENYTFSDGVIQCKQGKGGTIYTKQQYSNFVVHLEFKLPNAGNNGLAIRYPGHGKPAFSGMCELQVLDNTAKKYETLDPRQYHGSAYGMVPAKRGHLKPVGEWNQQTVTVIGSVIRVVLNGELILDADLSKVTEFMKDAAHPGKDLKQGHFGLVGHGDAVAFRNIQIKEIPNAK